MSPELGTTRIGCLQNWVPPEVGNGSMGTECLNTRFLCLYRLCAGYSVNLLKIDLCGSLLFASRDFGNDTIVINTYWPSSLNYLSKLLIFINIHVIFMNLIIEVRPVSIS